MTAQRQPAVAFFIRQGWTAQQSAGIVANLESESGLRPDAVGDGGQAYGIAQWHPPRQANFAAVLGKDIRGSSLEDQLYFVHAELRGTEQRAGEALAACTSAGDAGACVSKLYERPADTEGEAAKRARLAETIFKEYAGEGAAQPEPTAPQPAPSAPQGSRMNPLAILQMFSQFLLPMLPQAKNILQPPEGSNTARNIDLAQLLLSTIVQAAGVAPPAPAAGAVPTQAHDQMAQLAAAVAAMQQDLALQTKVRNAVVTQPKIVETLQVMEFGGGVEKAAERGAVAQQADKPFWYNPTFWVTALFFPMMYMITYQVLFTLAGPYLVSNGVPNTPLQANPWYAVVGFDPNTRTGLINLIVGFVFGGICGVWFGMTVAKLRSNAESSNQVATDAPVPSKF